MKSNLVLMLLLVGTSTMVSAQSYNVNTSYNHRDGYTNQYESDYYDGIYRRMTRSDRRAIDKLYSKLESRKRSAYRDGYVSDYEARRISDVERRIDKIYYKYKPRSNYRQSNYSRNYSYASSNRYRGCG